MTPEQSAYLDRKEAFLDQFIDQGSEHELFISSYIHGHFSVVAANMLNVSDDITEFQQTFQQALYQTIEQAIANNELSQSDAESVMNMLLSLFKDET